MGKSTLKMGFRLFEAYLEHLYRLMGSRWKHLDQATSGPDSTVTEIFRFFQNWFLLDTP